MTCPTVPTSQYLSPLESNALPSHTELTTATPKNSAFFNNITYKHPTVPTLYTALTSGANAMSPEIYGTYTHPMVLAKESVVQIVVNNLDSGRHPFHLHGHNFQTVHRSDEGGGTFGDAGVDAASFPATPMRRDTVVLYPQGNIVLRFKADNAGGFTLAVSSTALARKVELGCIY